MNWRVYKYLGISILGASLLAGCESHRYTMHRPVVVSPTGQVYVPHAPPPPRHESAGAPMSADDIWTPGYWTYSNSRWVWIPGHWQTPPQSGTTWVAGHWDETSRGWYWTPGHWE